MKRMLASRRAGFCTLLLLAILLALVLVACTGENVTETPTADETVSATEAIGSADVTEPDEQSSISPAGTDTEPAVPEDPTEPQSETDASSDSELPEESETEAPTETLDNSQRVNEPTDPAFLTFYDNKRNRTLFTGANQCKYEIVMDETYGSVLKLTTTQNASDPFIAFNYANYMKQHDLTAISADEYKFMVYTLRVENVSCDSFEMFYYAGNIAGATPGYNMTASFDSSRNDWQKIIFDLSNVDFSGDLHGMRWDFLTTPGGAGESVYIYSIEFFKTREEAMKNFDLDMTRPGEGSDLTEAPVDGVNYDKLNAPDEDASVAMWFDHMTEKLYQNDTTSSGMNTYVISMAGNSIENCQFFLAPENNRSFDVTLSAFSDGNGHTLRAEVLREHYVNVNGKMLPDALPPLQGAVAVKGGNSQGFVIKVWAEMHQPAGLYTATLDIKDAETGKHIKTANVYVNVWGFSLSEETALKTAIGLGDWPIVASYQNRGMNDMEYWDLYRVYYDFLLENRLCAYRLPYNLTDGRVTDYLNNPRVNSFVINKISDNESQAYSILSQNPDWMKKGFYYYVDEPTNMDLLNKLAAAGNRLSETFPGYRQVSPFFTNVQVDANTDQIDYMTPYTNIWCVKPFALTPRDKYLVAGAQFVTSRAQDEKSGTFAERMEALRAEGHELWLYVCWEPAQPYANWLALGDGTEPIVTIWQCAMGDATGMLYWDSAYWTADPMNDLTPLIGANSHGDGVLLYSGAQVGIYEPISSFRLENVRLGIQDYQLLSMLEAEQGQAAADEMIAMVTTDVITYTNDDDYLHAVRVLLGEKVNDLAKD